MNNNKKRNVPTGTTQVSVEWMAMGALAHRQGDGLMACTPGVSDLAERLCSLMADGAPAGHASFYALRWPGVAWSTLLHVQGDHMRFGGGVRCYTTRVAYECNDSQLERAGGYAPLVAALNAMHVYEQANYHASNTFLVAPAPASAPSADEQLLGSWLAYCLAHRQRLWISLGKKKAIDTIDTIDTLVADEVRRSPKLLALLRMVDRLPLAWRQSLSMAYAVEGRCPGTRALLPQLQVVAYHGTADDFGDAAQGAFIIDWTGDHPQVAGHTPDDLLPWPGELERLAAMPPPEARPQSDEQTVPPPSPRRSPWTTYIVWAAVVALITFVYIYLSRP